MPKGKKRKGGGGRRAKRRGGGYHFSAVGLGRKLAKLSAPIDAAVDGFQAGAGGDFVGGATAFLGTLQADLTAYNPLTKSWDFPSLAVGYGPAMVVEGVNTGLHFIKGFARAFAGRAGSRPAV